MMTRSLTRPLTRRSLLRGAGGIAIGLPLLEAMEQPAHGQPLDAPPRFVVFFTGNGTILDRWTPVGGVDDFVLDDPTDPGRILAPLEPHKQHLVVLGGVDMHSRDHGPGGNPHDLGMGHMLTATDLVVGPSGIGEFSHLPDGSAGGPSIDQVIAQEIGQETPFRSVELGVRANLDPIRQVTSRMCYRAPFEPLPPENNPRAAFTSLFASLDADPAELEAIAARRQSVLDRVKDDLLDLQGRLGAADRIKVDAHLQAIFEVEQSIEALGGLTGCTVPEEPDELDHQAIDNYPAVGRAHMDLMVMALTCDLTRVASLQWSTAQGGVRFAWLGHSMHHHNLSHEADNDATARDQLVAINRWYAEQFAYLLDRLVTQPEADGSLLDNTVVLWANELGNGDTHQKSDIPFIVAGNHKARIGSGRYLQYDHVAHNDLYVSLIQALGQPAVTTFGNPEVCSGPLAGLLA